MSKYVETNKIAQTKYLIPDIDTFETENDYILKADMPGVDKDNLEITVENESLTILGKVKVSDEQGYAYQEYNEGHYHKRFKIGRNIDQSKISATIETGVLTLTLPKAESVKPRKIEIQNS